MKKIEYRAPEMEVIELKNQVSLLSQSEPQGPGGSGIDD
jgi:hypothetical protein